MPGDVSLTRQPWALHQPFSHGLDSPRAVATTAAQVQRRHSMRRYRGKRTRPTALETTVTLRLSLGGARPPARPPSWCVPLPLGGSPPPRNCSEMFGSVRKMFGTGGAAPPAFRREVTPPRNVRKMFGNGSVPFPWVVVPAKMFGNVQKCSELVRPLHQPSPGPATPAPRPTPKTYRNSRTLPRPKGFLSAPLPYHFILPKP